ncbi:MAG: 50S ribosomal protein L11, partial [Candidatus Jacksonbacteria bacterium]|nr:50S ribosomal protein L11 [Candidatus Jacksonbacteria bacterium]
TQVAKGDIIPVVISVYEDRTYDFKLKTPPAAELLKKAVGIQKGSGAPHKTKVGKITKAQLEEIAKKKMPDLNTSDLASAVKTIAGTARQMGIEVVV